MSCITRHVYKEISDIYELEIDSILVEDCKKHLSHILVNAEEDMPEITEELIENLYDYEMAIPEIDEPVKVRCHNSTRESTVRDELSEFLDNYLYDFYIGEGDGEVLEVITEVQ